VQEHFLVALGKWSHQLTLFPCTQVAGLVHGHFAISLQLKGSLVLLALPLRRCNQHVARVVSMRFCFDVQLTVRQVVRQFGGSSVRERVLLFTRIPFLDEVTAPWNLRLRFLVKALVGDVSIPPLSILVALVALRVLQLRLRALTFIF